MRGSRYVWYKGKLVPRCAVEPTGFEPPGACGICGGFGAIPETIDEERHDVMVPCYRCQKFCEACKQWVKTEGHKH